LTFFDNIKIISPEQRQKHSFNKKPNPYKAMNTSKPAIRGIHTRIKNILSPAIQPEKEDIDSSVKRCYTASVAYRLFSDAFGHVRIAQNR
jgi:hypothetical protein